jgi:glycosyltransferase involved in cell wall biosynthesis
MIVMNVNFPPDVRIEKEARSLIAAGHQVMVVCPQSNSRPLEEQWEEIKIIRIAPLPKLWSKINALFFLVTHSNLLWLKRLQEIVDSFQIDVLHVHDLLPAATALALKKRNPRLKVVLDLHENYPFLLQERHAKSNPWPTKLWNNLFYNVKHWRKHERNCVTDSDRVIVVVEEAVERIMELGVPGPKILVIGNTPELDQEVSGYYTEQWQNRFKDNFLISYIGGINNISREVDVVVKAMPTIIKAVPNAHLCIVGNLSRQPGLAQLVAELRLDDYVTFTGWQPHESMLEFVDISDIGLVPSKRSQQTDHSSPNKLFWYMLRSKPIVASDCRSLKRIVQEIGGGVVYEAGNADSFAQAVISLKDEGLRKEMGSKGHQAVLKRYNWRVESGKLVKMYEEIQDKSWQVVEF